MSLLEFLDKSGWRVFGAFLVLWTAAAALSGLFRVVIKNIRRDPK